MASVKLITDVCVDTPAFVEFRLSPQPVDGLDQVLQAPHATRQAGLHRGWRRWLLELYFLNMAFRGPLITRRVRRMYQALERTQWLTAAEIRQLQEHRLRRLIRHAYHHVPFYRETFELPQSPAGGNPDARGSCRCRHPRSARCARILL
jgi:phenylacetate-CoA ligase